MPALITEDDIEKAVIERLATPDFGFQTLNCHTEHKETLPDSFGRTDKRDVVFEHRLRAALVKLNSTLPPAPCRRWRRIGKSTS